MLVTSDGPLCRAHDLVMLDLDGVVYVGGRAVPGAPEHLAAAREAGAAVAFITNNASRPPETVAAHLTELGVPAAAEDVVTSAQAAARVLVERFGAGARVALLGGPGLEAALAEAGVVAVDVDDESAVALVTGYGPEVLWREVMRAAVRVRDGLPWVASNTDLSIPTDYGVAPGHGVLVETIARFAEAEPVVAGKPARPLLDETVRRMDAQRPLMVGDRLDTDIEGAEALGLPSLLVLTGVSGLAEVVGAPEGSRPSYLAPDLAGLLVEHRAPERLEDGAALGGWHASVHDGHLVVAGAGTDDDWWRVVAAAAWSAADRDGSVPGCAGLLPGRATG
ncbi:HAD-IIA family hydrolase [Nocardioides sp. SYSU D00038]|uniref:HAD-IIA family hydrolase n=1 Tax=Nocardioides sp. SYSU D00038 TaxID=2812554 RepID=UPI001966D3F7|nr:HAD-IIA family hydrolase [Nocardioides sp. SYSU D00038]